MITRRLTIDELTDREARRLAIQDFIQEKKTVPSDTEIETLLSTTNAYHIIAKQNILAQKAAHEEALKAIGLNSIEVDVLDLDLDI